MTRLISSAIAILMLTVSIHAQAAPDAAELSDLLKEFLAGASRNDANIHDRFWSDDLIYTGSNGRRRGKDEIMKDVRSAPAPKPSDPVTTYSAEDIRIQQYGHTAIVAFRLVGATTQNGRTEVTNYLNTGALLKRKGKWQVVAWQATKVPEQSPAKTSTTTQQETTMSSETKHASGAFEVKMNPQADEKAEPTVGRRSLDKVFHGALEATSKGQMLAVMTDVQGSAGYVAMERVNGKLDGRAGTFALQHSGTMTRGKPELIITVVPDSGTGDLAGLTGRMTIDIVEGKHFYKFDYTVAKPN